MTGVDITRWRLHNQHLTGAKFARPFDVVDWLGAVQAQDYPASLWAVGLRLQDATEATIEAAIADKSIVRTWFMRGTLHFVTGRDIRALMALQAPRIRRLIANINRSGKLGLD